MNLEIWGRFRTICSTGILRTEVLVNDFGTTRVIQARGIEQLDFTQTCNDSRGGMLSDGPRRGTSRRSTDRPPYYYRIGLGEIGCMQRKFECNNVIHASKVRVAECQGEILNRGLFNGPLYATKSPRDVTVHIPYG